MDLFLVEKVVRCSNRDYFCLTGNLLEQSAFFAFDFQIIMDIQVCELQIFQGKSFSVHVKISV